MRRRRQSAFRDRYFFRALSNGHNHMYSVLSHGITAEAMVTDFSDYLENFWWPYVEDRVDHDLARITTRWACVEMIDSGIYILCGYPGRT